MVPDLPPLGEPTGLPHAAGADGQQASPAGGSERPRVLMLAHRLPYPPDRGDRIRSYHLIKVLSQHFDLGIACTSDEPVWLQHHQLLSVMAQRVTIQPIHPTFSKVRGVGSLLTGGAITPAYHYRQGLAQEIMRWHEEQPFDAVLTFCTGMIEYARLLTRSRQHGDAGPPRPGHVLDLVDVDSLKWSSYARQSWPPMSWAFGAEASRLRQIESGKLDEIDAITVVSQAEAQAYREQVSSTTPISVVRNGVDLEYFYPQPDNPGSREIVFVGVLNYRPNVEGIAWFVREVMPLLRQRVPDARLRIVGRHPTQAVHDLGQDTTDLTPPGQGGGVEVVGSVPDVRTYLESASAVIAPLLIARGTQNKVLEGMSSQRVAVCTPGAAAGIDAQDGEHLVVARTPAEWAEKLEKVMIDGEYRRRIARAARQRIEACYAWDQAIQPMVELLKASMTPHRH